MKTICFLLACASCVALPTVAPAHDDTALRLHFGKTGSRETDSQWGLEAINAHKAYQAGFTGKDVEIGLIDTGLDSTHREFEGRVSPYSLDYSAFLSSYSIQPVVTDTIGHGTHVGGVLAANRDNRGIHGVAYGATLLPVAISNPARIMATVRDSLFYLAGFGVEIVNASFGLEGDMLDPDAVPYDVVATFYSPVRAAYEAERQGIVMVWAASNSSDDNVGVTAGLPHYFPSLESTTLAVTAIDHTGHLASYASRCGVAARWCLAAPGGDQRQGHLVGIVSVSAGAGYTEGIGTSLAAPHVTGALAIAREMFPEPDIRDLRLLILNTAADIGTPGLDTVYGWGRLDLGNLVETIAPEGRGIFASAAWGRHLAMRQIGRMPFDGLGSRASSNHRLWMAGDLATGRLAAAPGKPAAEGTSKALMLGIDLFDDADVVAGFGIAHTDTNVTGRGTANSASAEGFHGFAYGRFDGGDWYARSSAGLSHFSQHHLRRSIPGLSGTVLGLYGPAANSYGSVWGGFADLEAGRALDLGMAQATLFARLSGAHQRFDATRETGLELLGYDLHAGSLSTAEIGPGLRLSETFDLGDWSVRPELEIAYARVAGAERFTRNTTLLGRQMEAGTAALGRDRVDVGAKLDLRLAELPLSASLGYSGSYRSAERHHRFRFGASLRF